MYFAVVVATILQKVNDFHLDIPRQAIEIGAECTHYQENSFDTYIKTRFYHW